MTNVESPQQTATSTIDQALQQAVAHHQAGQLQDAERLYRAILQAHPHHPDANHNLGVLAVQVKQSLAGLPHFKAALEANPNQGQYWLSYIDALMQTGQIDAARQMLEQGRQRGLQGEEVEALAGRLEALAGRLEAASGSAEPLNAEYRQAIKKLSPALSVIPQNGKNKPKAKPAKPDKSARKSVPHQQKNPSPQEINTLVALFSGGRYAEAATLAQMMTERFPLHGFGWKVLGAALQQMGQRVDALVPVQKAVALSPNDSEAHYNLGVTFQGLGRLDEAEVSYRRALEIRSNFAEVHYNLGNTLKELGRLDEAEASYRRALQIKPDYVEAHSNLGTTLVDLGRLDEAEASCRRVLKIKPDFAEAHNNLGATLHALGRLDDAEASYRRALQINPNWASLYFDLHSLLLNPGDMAPSIKCMEKAIEIDPSNVNYKFFLGMLLDYSGALESAAEYFTQVEKSANKYRARLDAWRYLKSANNTFPLITGSNIQAFKLGMAAATNEGLVLEFGVRFGSSIRQIAALVGQEVHGFDSFEGLPEQWHHEPKGSYSTKGVIPNVPDNVALYAGWFEDTLPEFLKNHSGPVRFVNIDCDIYSSTKTVLDLLAERIIPGTVIVFDEYIGNEHWREDEFKAFQEAVAQYGWDYEYLCFSFFTKQVVIRIL